MRCNIQHIHIRTFWLKLLKLLLPLWQEEGIRPERIKETNGIQRCHFHLQRIDEITQTN